MSNIKSVALTAPLILVLALITAVSAKEIELSCKTTSGKSVPYQVITSPPSIKDTRDGEKYEVVVFSQSKLVFRKKLNINLGGGEYYDTEFLYSINRSNLDYQVSIKTSTNGEKLKPSGDGTYIGKCVVTPKKPVIF